MAFEEEFFQEIKSHNANMMAIFQKYPVESEKYHRYYKEQLENAEKGGEDWNRWFSFPETGSAEEFILFHDLQGIRDQILVLVKEYLSPTGEITFDRDDWDYPRMVVVEFETNLQMYSSKWNEKRWEFSQKLRELFDYKAEMYFAIRPSFSE